MVLSDIKTKLAKQTRESYFRPNQKVLHLTENEFYDYLMGDRGYHVTLDPDGYKYCPCPSCRARQRIEQLGVPGEILTEAGLREYPDSGKPQEKENE